MKRSSCHAVGLLSLSEEVILRILSFLCPLSLAAVRLVCRALRKAATSDRQRVKLVFDSWYSATAIASPKVLRAMHSFHGLLERLDDELKEMDADLKTVPDRPGYRHTRRWLHFQLLASVAPEVVSLVVAEQWCRMEADSDELLYRPQRLLAQMPLLKSLGFLAEERAVGKTILQKLPALRHLKRLKFSKTPRQMGIQLICNTLALTELDLGSVGAGRAAVEDYRSRLMLDRLAHGETSGLQTLALNLPAKEVLGLSMLTGLSSLTNLQLETWDPPCDLGGLATLTGLESLSIWVVARYDIYDLEVDELGEAIAASLSPLSALTRLSSLDLSDCSSDLDRRKVSPDVSALSCLTALRVLCCSAFDVAEVVAGDPLPVQLRFLRSATALEELDLGFWGSFWSLPDASRYAVRAAVSALRSLTGVKIRMQSPERWSSDSNYYAPLAALASAASIESLSFAIEAPVGYIPSLQTIADARGCLTALTKLQALHLDCIDEDFVSSNCVEFGIIPDTAGLLAGLPSTRLATLDLNIHAATAEVMAQIARFSNLQGLTLLCSSASMRFLDPLFDLKCLTGLHLSLDAKAMREQHGRGISNVKADVARLKSAIIDASRVVGRHAIVDISIS